MRECPQPGSLPAVETECEDEEVSRIVNVYSRSLCVGSDDCLGACDPFRTRYYRTCI